MSQLRFPRALGVPLVVEVTVYDRRSQRQSLAGVTDLSATIWKPDFTTVVVDDMTHASIAQVDLSTAGDVGYHRPDDGAFERGTYLMRFKCTIAGEAIAFPEDEYILIDFN